MQISANNMYKNAIVHRIVDVDVDRELATNGNR